MKTGKVSESILKRSVLKEIKTKRPEIVLGAGVGEDCAAVKVAEDEILVLSTDPITGASQDIGIYAIQITANDLASSGAEPIGAMISLLLPEGTQEAELKQLMCQMQENCETLHMQIMGGHTEVTKVVNQPVVTVTGVGKARRDSLVSTGGALPGDDIVLTKWIGLEGTSILAAEKEDELLARFSRDFIKKAQSFRTYLSVVPEGMIAVKQGVHAMHDVTEGGIFGALWEMAEASGVGLEVDLLKIPVKQETIEVCEFFGINPYELISSGSMLMAAADGNGLVQALEKEGIAAKVIGKATSGNDRVLMNQEERRFLEPPKADELYKVI